MTFAEAFDRLDELHRRRPPLPDLCRICARHNTTSTDRVCGVCRTKGWEE